jgi:hypothetical protein
MNENMITDYQEREIWYSLILSKEGPRDKTFDNLVEELIKKLKQLKLPVWDELLNLLKAPGAPPNSLELLEKSELPEDKSTKRLFSSLVGLNNPNTLTTSTWDLKTCWFEFQIQKSWIPKDRGPQYDKLKKDIQALIARDKKYKDYQLTNTWSYILTEDEKKELDVSKIVSGIAQQLVGTKLSYNPEVFTQEGIESFRKHTIDTRLGYEPFLILESITLTTITLENSFYTRVERLLNYLASKGLVREPYTSDVEERYLKAIEDCNKESHTPTNFLFFVDCWPMTIEKFLLLKEELLKELEGTSYQIRLDSNPLHTDRYGCYLTSVPKDYPSSSSSL